MEGLRKVALIGPEAQSDLPKLQDARFTAALAALQNGDVETARREATSLVDEGYDHAYTLLGRTYEKRAPGDAPADTSKALFYYLMGVDTAGAVESWLGLARLFYLGIGVEQDRRKAFAYYSTVVEESENGLAHLMIGKMYLDGDGVEQNLALAEKHLMIAREKHYVFAYSYLGTVCFRRKQYLQGVWNRLQAAFKTFKRLSPASRTRRI